MRDLQDTQNNKTTSLFANSTPVAKGKFEPYINREEARFITKPLNNIGDGYVSAEHPFREEFEAEVNGLDFDTVSLSTPVSLLPRYIPIIPYQRKDLLQLEPLKSAVIGINIRDILSSQLKKEAGMLRTKGRYSFRKNILTQYKEAGFVILFSSSPDVLIEDMWYMREELDLFNVIKEMGFTVSTSMDFSVYEGVDPYAQHLNMKKSLIYSQELQKKGIVPITNIYSLHQYHREKHLRWLIKNPAVNYISICCKMQCGSPEHISILIDSIKFFIDNTPQDLHILLEGFPINEVKRLKGYLNNIHIADQVTIHNAHCGKKEIFNKKTETLENTRRSDHKNMTKEDRLKLSLHNISERDKMLTYLADMEMKKAIHTFPYELLTKVTEIS